jgi:hypothetical protein
MPCVLAIIGKNFDVDAFIKRSSIQGYRKGYRGEPVFKSKPEGNRLDYSRLSVQPSKADFNNLKKQIADSIRYLKKHKHKLSLIRKTKGIDFAILDFGINLRIDKKEILLQSDRFPNELLKLAGELGLGIELSIYPEDLQIILEKKNKKS